MKTPEFTNELCIVSLSSSPWEHPLWVSRQFLMYELAAFCPVLYTTGRSHIRNLFSFEKLKSSFFSPPPPFFPPDNLTVQKPPLTTPKIFKYKTIDRFLAHSYGRLLKKKCRKLSRGKIIAYVWEPGHMDLIEGLHPDIVIYHPYDKFDAMAETDKDKKEIQVSEKAITKIADMIITPHQKVAASLQHANTHIVHNGVFLPAMADRSIPKNTLFKHIPHPRLGYIGMISTKLDFQLILEIAQEKPEFSIILMGPMNLKTEAHRKKIQQLQQTPNIHFFPPVSFDRVFDHMLQFDLGIMPYCLLTHMNYCESPLKMYQYWLCGLPVVTTGLPNIVETPGIIFRANTSLGWIDKIEQALENESESLKEKRHALAMENSWENRAAQIYGLLAGHEKIKQG